jgi:hypothetical protein
MDHGLAAEVTRETTGGLWKELLGQVDGAKANLKWRVCAEWEAIQAMAL